MPTGLVERCTRARNQFTLKRWRNAILNHSIHNVNFAFVLRGGQTLLHVAIREAVQSPHDEEAKHLALMLCTHTGIDVNVADRSGRSPLHLALEGDDGDVAHEVVEALLRQGADMNQMDALGITPTMVAACNERITLGTLLLLFRAGARNLLDVLLEMRSCLTGAMSTDGLRALIDDVTLDVNRPVGPAGQTLLHSVLHAEWASRDREGFVQTLCSRTNINVNSVDAELCTPLHVAAARGEMELSVLDTLLKAQANPNMQDREGCTALHRLLKASRGSTHDKVKVLLAAGASVNASDRTGGTPAQLAASSEEVEVRTLPLILQSGADNLIELLLSQVRRPILPAIEALLGEPSLDINRVVLPASGQSLIHAVISAEWAAPQRLTLVESVCRRANLNVNAVDHRRNTALHLALQANQEPAKLNQLLHIIGTLVQVGCNVNAENADGCTPVQLLLNMRQPCAAILQVLMAGADVNRVVVPATGQTLLHILVSAKWAAAKRLSLVGDLCSIPAIDVNCADHRRNTALHAAVLALRAPDTLEPSVGDLVVALPGKEFVADGVEFYRAGDEGLVTKDQSGKLSVRWLRTGTMSTVLKTLWEYNYIVKYKGPQVGDIVQVLAEKEFAADGVTYFKAGDEGMVIKNYGDQVCIKWSRSGKTTYVALDMWVDHMAIKERVPMVSDVLQSLPGRKFSRGDIEYYQAGDDCLVIKDEDNRLSLRCLRTGSTFFITKNSWADRFLVKPQPVLPVEEVYFGHCDRCSAELSMGPDWYHQRGSEHDLCRAHWLELEESQQASFANISSPSQLGHERAGYADPAQLLQSTWGRWRRDPYEEEPAEVMVAIISTLVKARCDVNAENTDGQTPVHILLSMLGADGLMEAQAAGGAPAQPAGATGQRRRVGSGVSVKLQALSIVLEHAAYLPHQLLELFLQQANRPVLHLVEALIDDAALDVNYVLARAASRTLLHLIVSEPWSAPHRGALVRKLCSRSDINVNAVDCNGQTPLHMICKAAREDATHDMIQVLLSARADVGIRDGAGKSPAEIASRNAGMEVRSLLKLQEGADPAGHDVVSTEILERLAQAHHAAEDWQERNLALCRTVEQAQSQSADLQRQIEELQQQPSIVFDVPIAQMEVMHMAPSDTLQCTTREHFYREAESHFLRQAGKRLQGRRVIAVDMLMNGPLWQRYRRRRPETGAEERWGFHGTGDTGLQRIIAHGFEVGGEGVPMLNGAARGHGVYLAKSPDLSSYFASGTKMIMAQFYVHAAQQDRDAWVIARKEDVYPRYVIYY